MTAAVLAALLPVLFGRHGRWSSLVVISITQAVLQAWCYNTASHPANSYHQLWGIVPASDANLYYSQACELLNGQRFSLSMGPRHPYPVFLATVLSLCGHDFRLATLLCTVLMALATWAAFEVVRVRLGGLAAAVYLVCITFYIRTFCTGLFMTEHLGLLFSLCAVAMLVESLCRENRSKIWLWFGGLLFLTQALNTRPAAYMTLPFLVLAAWPLTRGDFKIRAKMVGLSASVVAACLLIHFIGHRVVVMPPRGPSNVWSCIYGLLNGGTWLDGKKRAQELAGPQNTPSGDEELKKECLAEIKRNPAKLVHGWLRAVGFVWEKNTPFRQPSHGLPSKRFTEASRRCAVLGLVLSIIFLFRRPPRMSSHRVYNSIGWLCLSAVLGMIASLPFAPPWDGRLRILAATLPLYYLLPAVGLSGLFALLKGAISRRTDDSQREPAQKAIARSMMPLATGMAGILFLVVVLAPFAFIKPGTFSTRIRHPVLAMSRQTILGTLSKPVDLTALKSGYLLHISEAQRTWLPTISRADFVKGSRISEDLKRVPDRVEILALPYWVLLVLADRDVDVGTFMPAPQHIGRHVEPQVYFSRELRLLQEPQ